MILFNWKLTPRLIYSGACEGQMPEILSMIQVGNKLNLSGKKCLCLSDEEDDTGSVCSVHGKQLIGFPSKYVCVAGDLVLLLPLLFQHLCPDELCWLCHLGI